MSDRFEESIREIEALHAWDRQQERAQEDVDAVHRVYLGVLLQRFRAAEGIQRDLTRDGDYTGHHFEVADPETGLRFRVTVERTGDRS